MDNDAIRTAFEADYFGDLPATVPARQQGAHGTYTHAAPQHAWTIWQRAWAAALASAAYEATDDDAATSREQYKRMFHAACADLGAVNEALGLDPDDGGAEPILAAIEELKTSPAIASAAPAAVAGPSEPVGRVDSEGSVTWFAPIPEGGANLYAAPTTQAAPAAQGDAALKACMRIVSECDTRNPAWHIAADALAMAATRAAKEGDKPCPLTLP